MSVNASVSVSECVYYVMLGVIFEKERNEIEVSAFDKDIANFFEFNPAQPKRRGAFRFRAL